MKYYILFALIIIINAYMDSLNFHRPHNLGFWSLKTRKDKVDAWHTSKMIMLAFIAYGFVGFDLMALCIFAIISLTFHQLFLHFIFKPRSKT